MKTKEELEQIKEEYTELNKKLSELTKEELKEVAGGFLDVSACPISDTCTQDPAKCNLHVGNNYSSCHFCPKT